MFFQPTFFSWEKCLLLFDAKLVLSFTCLHTSTTCNETKLTKSSPRAEKTLQFVSTIDMSPHESDPRRALKLVSEVNRSKSSNAIFARVLALNV